MVARFNARSQTLGNTTTPHVPVLSSRSHTECFHVRHHGASFIRMQCTRDRSVFAHSESNACSSNRTHGNPFRAEPPEDTATFRYRSHLPRFYPLQRHVEAPSQPSSMYCTILVGISLRLLLGVALPQPSPLGPCTRCPAACRVSRIRNPSKHAQRNDSHAQESSGPGTCRALC